MNSKILLSSIVHKRFGKINHLFKYKVPSIFLDLDEFEKVKKNSYIFSINSFNILSFNEKDHGYRDDRKIRDYIIDHLKKYNVQYKKEPEEALKWIEKAEEISPNNIIHLLIKAQAYWVLDQPFNASEVINQILEINPNNEKVPIVSGSE